MSVNSLWFKCALLLLVFSCEGPGGEIGPAGKNSIVIIDEEQAGTNCSNGGQKIQSGIDLDDNGQLSTAEIDQTQYICNGKNGLVNVNSEPSGPNCTNGGLRIELGIDQNGNGSLESSEVTQVKFLCGSNGLNTLTIYTKESPGDNCEDGGFKIESGLDINSNLVLESEEIQATKYFCAPETNNDKQVRLEIGESNVQTFSTDWDNMPYQTYRLIKFNKQNYTNVDSITFVPSIYTPYAGNTVSVELYNWTDNVEINNSQLTSNTVDWIFKESKDIFDQLPNKEITLGIRLKTENSNYPVSMGIRSYLFIYRH